VAVSALFSAAVSYLSVRVPYTQWHRLFTSPASRAAIPSLAGIHASATASFNLEMFTWTGSTIRGNAWLLSTGKALMAPAAWNEHHAGQGWLLLLGFVAAAGLAILVARLADHDNVLHQVR
jgi:hypothetical protein